MLTDEFKREERYIVFKVSDLGNSLKGDDIRVLAREYAKYRQSKWKPPLECLVVESDWPEYEPTWKAIAARMTGRAIEAEVLQAQEPVAMDDTTYSMLHLSAPQPPAPCPKCENDARRSEYWKAEHLAGNAVITELQAKVAEQSAEIDRLTEQVRYRTKSHEINCSLIAEKTTTSAQQDERIAEQAALIDKCEEFISMVEEEFPVSSKQVLDAIAAYKQP